MIVFLTEFGRKFRPLDLIKYWKVSELRNVTFYGLSALHSIIHENLVAHFLLLSLAIRLLADYSAPNRLREACSFIAIYQKKVTLFFTDSADVYIMHSISNLADQVKTIGPLSSISALGFENANYQLSCTVSQTVSSQATPDFVVKSYLRKFRVEQKKRSFYSNQFRLSNHINEMSVPPSFAAAVRAAHKLPEDNCEQKLFFANISSFRTTWCAHFAIYCAKTKADFSKKNWAPWRILFFRLWCLFLCQATQNFVESCSHSRMGLHGWRIKILPRKFIRGTPLSFYCRNQKW